MQCKSWGLGACPAARRNPTATRRWSEWGGASRTWPTCCGDKWTV